MFGKKSYAFGKILKHGAASIIVRKMVRNSTNTLTPCNCIATIVSLSSCQQACFAWCQCIGGISNRFRFINWSCTMFRNLTERVRFLTDDVRSCISYQLGKKVLREFICVYLYYNFILKYS